MADDLISPNSPEEWDLEQRVFQAAGRQDVPEDVRTTIADLWRQFVLRESFLRGIQADG